MSEPVADVPAAVLSPHTLGLARELVSRLRTRGQTVGTAESLTAGLCAAALTSVSGASAVVRGGLIVYATDLKASLGDVPADELAAHGPVSEVVAAALASGARGRTGADWGLALTGVAGPNGQDGHPPGTVWVAACGPTWQQTRLLALGGDRAAIRDASVAGVLELCMTGLE